MLCWIDSITFAIEISESDVISIWSIDIENRKTKWRFEQKISKIWKRNGDSIVWWYNYVAHTEPFAVVFESLSLMPALLPELWRMPANHFRWCVCDSITFGEMFDRYENRNASSSFFPLCVNQRHSFGMPIVARVHGIDINWNLKCVWRLLELIFSFLLNYLLIIQPLNKRKRELTDLVNLKLFIAIIWFVMVQLIFFFGKD